MRNLASLAFFALITLPAGAGSQSPGKAVPSGAWGGDHISVTTTATGAEVEFDCAHGKIAKPLMLDAQNHFDAQGSFASEHSGPVRPEDQSAATAARYSGEVTGNDMTLKVSLGEQTVGTFTLTRNQPPVLRKCR